MSNDIERYPLTLIIDSEDFKENNTKYETGQQKFNRIGNSINQGVYDIYLDNITTYNASHAEDKNKMAFITMLALNNDNGVSSILGVSASDVAISHKDIVVPNESKNASDVCVSHKARKMNYVGYINIQPGGTLNVNTFKISFLDGKSIFKTVNGRVIAEYILVRRKESMVDKVELGFSKIIK